MSTNAVILEGRVKPDGSLEVTDKVPLPVGRVRVTVVPIPDLPEDDPFWQRMQAIWNSQNARGHVPRSVEEVEGERRAVRDEWEERSQEMEKIQSPGRAIPPAGEPGE
jgi:hypothetical protein